MSIDVIFLGLDGVIFDTEAAHLAACNAAFEQAGMRLHWTLQQLRKAVSVHGHARAVVAALTDLPLAHGQAAMADLLAESQRAFQRSIAAGMPEAIPACMALIDEAMQAGCKVSILTDMPAPASTALLEHAFGHELTSTFAVVAGGVNFIGHGALGPYAQALHAMEIDARSAIAIDANAAGLRAARAAGLWTVSVAPLEADTSPVPGMHLWCPPSGGMRQMPVGHGAAPDRAQPFLTFRALRALKCAPVHGWGQDNDTIVQMAA